MEANKPDPYGCLRIAEDVCLPKEVAQEVTLITGTRGTGKSTSAAIFMEELNKNGLIFITFDCLGAHRKIRLPKVKVVDVPPGVPVDPKVLVATVLNGNQSLILNLLEVPVDQQQRLVARFAEEILAARPAQYGKTVTVIVEEAQEFAPMGNARRIYESIIPLDRLTKTGRAHGIGVIYITQRPQDFSTRLRSQTYNFIIHNLRNMNELRLVKEHVAAATLKEADAIVSKVYNFQPGDALIMSPHVPNGMVIVHIRQRETEHAGTNMLGEMSMFDTKSHVDSMITPSLMSPMSKTDPMVFGSKNDISEILNPNKPTAAAKWARYGAMAMGLAIVSAVAYIFIKTYRDQANVTYDAMEKQFSVYSSALRDSLDPKNQKPIAKPKTDHNMMDAPGAFDDSFFNRGNIKASSLLSEFHGPSPFKTKDPRKSGPYKLL
jgi:hypothetical protein